MKKRDLEIGDVVQLDPKHKFGGMFVVVTEPNEWGCQGYLCSPVGFEAVRYKNLAYVRPKWEDIEYVGKMHWILDGEISENA